jgi:hypothetical protein
LFSEQRLKKPTIFMAMMKSLYSFLFLALATLHRTGGFLPPCFGSSSRSRRVSSTNTLVVLFSGKGIATEYSWAEEAFELEITVNVPKDTKAKDIAFKATSTSIDLRLKNQGDDDEEIVLLDPSRKLRGRVVMDGTYWVISDPEDSDGQHRQVTVTIEKQIRTAKDDFDVIDYDWKGVYSQEEEGEVSFRKYDEPEPLDVRDYAASLGVDIDNINMSLVDKTMFSSGLNLTQSSIDSLKETGLMKEVTQQQDGSEWVTDEDGDRVPFSTMGNGVSNEEIQESSAPKIPFLDTNSPWHKAVPVEAKADYMKKTTENVSSEEKSSERDQKKMELQKQREEEADDPIGTLTVARLKEILRSRGLKVSGNKKELQERLRAQVQSMLKNKNETLSS